MAPRPHTLRLAWVISALLWACSDSLGPAEGLPTPKQTDDGWPTAPLLAVGMDPDPVQDLVSLIDGTPDHLIHSVVIARHGTLVFEKYWPGWDLAPGSLDTTHRDFDRETLHYVASVSKSITSMLTGIALQEGAIGSLDAPLFSFFPDYAELADSAKAAVTLRTLLAFSSGLYWSEFEYGFDHPMDSHYQMFRAEDPIRYLLERDVVSRPGEEFHYNSGDNNLVGEIVRRATSSDILLDYLEDRLFRPLGITDYLWAVFGQAPNLTFASGGAHLRPRDMAKLGQLYLDRGVWQGTRVVPADWVDASVEVSTPFTFGYRTLYGYGFNWWLGWSAFRDTTADYFRASGWGGQEVFVYPSLDLVIVFTQGTFYEDPPLNINDLIEDYIFAAVTS